MRYQVDFMLLLKLQKISYYFGLCRKILLANQFSGFFPFDLFDLLILIPGIHCYIVLVFYCFTFDQLNGKTNSQTIFPELIYRHFWVFFNLHEHKNPLRF